MKKQKITRKEVKERNQKMYEMYMNNENLGNRDIARIFNLSLQSVDVILNKIKKENNTKRSIKPRANNAGVTYEQILKVFKKEKSLNKTSEKLKVSNTLVSRIVRKYGLGHLIYKVKAKLTKSELKEREHKIWEFFINEKPTSYTIIAEKFNLSTKRIKIIMRDLKKKNNYPLGIIPKKPKKIKITRNTIKKVKIVRPVKPINPYEKVALEKGIDIKNLFAY